MADRRAIVVLVLFVALIAAVFVFNRSNAPGSSDVANSAPPLVPTTTEAPLLNATPESSAEFDAIAQRLVDLENELFSSPDPDRVGEIMLVDCSCYADTQRRLTNLERNGWRVDGADVVLRRASVLNATGDTIEGVLQVGAAGRPTVDSTGRVIEESPTGSFQPLVYTVKKGQDGVWRIFDRRLPEEIF